MNSVWKDLLGRYPQLEVCLPAIEQTFDLLVATYERGGKLLLCGNGGSASDAAHIVGELMKGFLQKRPLPSVFRRTMKERNPALPESLLDQLQGALPAIDLGESLALGTAFSNDVNPEYVYAQQVLGLGRENDTLIGISTSGNAANVVAAMHVAKGIGMCTIALTGKDGGQIARIADVAIVVPSNETFQIQELHLPIYHALCIALETRFFG
ncbi:MAG: SIS domain-containing protein [Kiritimatiellae bacterium]|nr:SIS domain-containing protein [Kiritimatiellia bacterium]